MPRCSACHHDVIHTVGPDAVPVILDAHARTFDAVDIAHLFPQDGDAVRTSRALVEHKAVCAAVREGEARARGARRKAKEPA